MATANLSRGPFDVDLPLIEDSRTGTPNLDVGKPNLNIQTTGGLDPRFIDQRSQIKQYILLGRYTDSNSGYDQAIELADLIKSGLDGEPITLDIDLDEYDTESVVPQAGQQQALQIEYEAGARHNIGVNLGLTAVDRVNGTVETQAETPTDSFGNGPITITGPNETVEITQDPQVTRTVGRPESDIGSDTGELPYYNDRFRSAYDSFDLEFQNSSTDDVRALEEMFSNQLATQSLTLDFNGIYGLGEFNVVPSGTQALRHMRTTGISGQIEIPIVSLRVVM